MTNKTDLYLGNTTFDEFREVMVFVVNEFIYSEWSWSHDKLLLTIRSDIASLLLLKFKNIKLYSERDEELPQLEIS